MSQEETERRADVLIAAAHPLELAGLVTALGPHLRAELHGLRVVAASVGVGLAEAGGGSARALREERPRGLVLVGSYGLYPGGEAFSPGRLLVPARICGLDSAVLAGKAAFPDPMLVTLEPDGKLSSALAAGSEPVLRGALGVTLGITTDDALALELAHASGCCAENLEALAVGLACRALGIAFGALLGCTNAVGSRGRAQWAEHNALAANKTAERLLGWLARGAPGLPDR